MSLTARGVTFGYARDEPLLRDVELHVDDGRSAVVMGPSGSGKSTLLSLLGGLRRPAAGSVTIGGPTGERTRPRLSWVFQSMHLIGARTVLDNVAVAALSLGFPRRASEDRARTALDRFGVGTLAARRQSTLSGGQAQRVALARAAVGEPLVVLADEPTANLDRRTADAVLAVLFSGFPTSALVVTTHDPAVAAAGSAAYDLLDGALVRRDAP